MSPRDRDPSLPAIPEKSECKFRSSDWDDEDAEDREEQGLFERDNIVTVDGRAEGGETGTRGSTISAVDCADGSEIESGSGNDRPFYVPSAAGDSWELTWPIWHMLPRNERRDIAAQHGMKSIGEFEEYMSLARAFDESESNQREGSRIAVLTNNDSSDTVRQDVGANGSPSDLSPGSSDTNWHPPFIGGVEEDDEDDPSISSNEENPTDPKVSSPCNNVVDNNLENHLEIVRLGGLPCSIPDEILHKCFAYLPVDNYATLALVSPYWSRFTRCESLYKKICQRIYLNQSKRKALNVSRFGNSYRNMLELRPRVRTGGGLYVLKYQEVRKIERDMTTEIPVGAILETVYYRYIYFFEDGRVMYALTHATPIEMIPRFIKMLLHGCGSKDKWGVWGRYQIRKDEVRVWVSHAWHDVCFRLKVIPSNKVLHYDLGDRGRCTTMVLEQHMSSASGNFEDDSYDLVKYGIPNQCYFRFLRDRRL